MAFYYARLRPRNEALGHLLNTYSHRMPSGEYRLYSAEKSTWYAIDDDEREHLLTVPASPHPEAPCAFIILTPEEKAEMERSQAQRLMDRKQVIVQEVVHSPVSLANIPSDLAKEVSALEAKHKEELKEEAKGPGPNDLSVAEVRPGRGRRGRL